MNAVDFAVKDPHWGWLIVAYFFLGGIAAGSYAIATLARLFGDEADRRATRPAYYLAFPLVCVCGVLLVVDLNRPERFWHMLIGSETLRPIFKWWSPMSVGSWGLSLFGGFSLLSFLGVLVEDGRLTRGPIPRIVAIANRPGITWVLEVLGTLSAFFLGAYTGTLLSATNQPVWAQSDWISPLFLASAASSGIAAILLWNSCLSRELPREATERLARLDRWASGFELILIAIFVGTLGELGAKTFGSGVGLLLPCVVVPLILPVPALLEHGRIPGAARLGPVLVLIGGLALRVAVVGVPSEILKHAH